MEPSCLPQGLHLNGRQELFKQQGRVVYKNAVPLMVWLLPITVSALVSPARQSGKVSELCESLLGRQISPLSNTSFQLFPSLGMGFWGNSIPRDHCQSGLIAEGEGTLFLPSLYILKATQQEVPGIPYLRTKSQPLQRLSLLAQKEINSQEELIKHEN